MTRRRLDINGRFLTQNITGVQRYGRELVTALDRLKGEGDPLLDGWDLTLIAPKAALIDPPALRYISLRGVGSLSGHAWEQADLPRHLTGDVLFCPGNTAPLTALVSARPVVTTVHDLSYKYFPSAYSYGFRALYSVLMPSVLHRSAAVITVSRSERAEILRHYPQIAPHLHVVANGGLPQDAVRTAKPVRGGRPYFLYVGALSARKNFPMVLRAAEAVLKDRDVRLLIAGEANATFKAHKASLDPTIRNRIEFLGQTDKSSDLVALYRGAVALLFPSRYESSGLPPAEAMACFCPVIASTIPSLRERCRDAALYCDPDDVGSLVTAMLRILDDTQLRTRLVEAGTVQARTLDWKTCARETLRVIAETLAARLSVPTDAAREAA